jgi:hypothetical protein
MNLRYTYPPQIILGLLRDLILLRRRSFHEDSYAIISKLQSPLQIRGEENIPSRGPYVLTLNHYTRTGFQIWWAAFAISSVIPSHIHWIITGEWTAPGKWYEPLKGFFSRFVAKRIVDVYNFTRMPPMPPRPQDVGARAASVRSLLTYGRHHGNQVIIGLAPEGRDQPNGRLIKPAPGLGRFCLLLAGQHLGFLPVGFYESKEELNINFGKPFKLKVRSGLPLTAKDAAAADIIMTNIAALLPDEFRGEYN